MKILAFLILFTATLAIKEVNKIGAGKIFLKSFFFQIFDRF